MRRRVVAAIVAGWVVVAGVVTFTIVDMVHLTASGAAGPAGGSSVTVRENGLAFTPRVIEAAPGRRVSIRIVNDSWTDHTFTMPRFGVDLTLAPGDVGTATFTVPRAGSIPFFCRFHQAIGMKGQLTVQVVG